MSITQILKFIQKKIGLSPKILDREFITSNLLVRMKHHGIDSLSDYASYLRVSPEELPRLIDMIVVPETSFFRNTAAFAFLRKQLIQKYSSSATSLIKILSVPCSSGEEPYSIAMLCANIGILEHRISIEAMDISKILLQQARRGIYGDNSFRNNYLDARNHYFQKTAQGYLLQPYIQKQVIFRQQNILATDLKKQKRHYDIIFCRNLMIYFEKFHKIQLLDLLNLWLKQDGLLFVGASEAIQLFSDHFQIFGSSACFCFHKKKACHSTIKLTRKRHNLSCATFPNKGIEKKRDTQLSVKHDAYFIKARQLADAGNLMDAEKLCKKSIEQFGISADKYYLMGILQESQGRIEAAEEYFHKSLYLKPDCQEAAIRMALICEGQKRHQEAAILKGRVQRLGSKNGTTPAP